MAQGVVGTCFAGGVAFRARKSYHEAAFRCERDSRMVGRTGLCMPGEPRVANVYGKLVDNNRLKLVMTETPSFPNGTVAVLKTEVIRKE